METTTKKLTEWAVNKIKTEYLNDVALLVAVEGHSVNGDGHGECFDYFIPSTDRGNELSQTFIINGIGYDLYPRSWERTERTANLDDRATICLSNAKILYSSKKEDEDRFYSIQKKLYDNLGDKAFIYKKALENLNISMDLYRTLMFEDAVYKVRMAAGYIDYYLSLAVAYLNGTSFRNWREGRLTELQMLKEIPENFIEYHKAVINTQAINELKSLAHLMISVTRKFIASHKSLQAKVQDSCNFSGLANWYQELSLTFRRLRFYCEIGNSDAAFEDACNLQNELIIVKEEFGLHEMDLLGSFDTANLMKISSQATELEKYIVLEIENHEINLNKYDTLEAFLSRN